jgi:hypothetical protein
MYVPLGKAALVVPVVIIKLTRRRKGGIGEEGIGGEMVERDV